MTDISTKRYNLDNFEASFREFLQNHGRAGQAPPLQGNSIKNYLSDLRHFWGWFTFYLHSNHAQAGQAPPLQENRANTLLFSHASMIDFEAVSSYKRYLESNNLPSKTINRRLSTLRKFCTFCIQQNWMKENPAKKVTNIGSINERRDGACPVSTEKSINDANVETQNFASLQNDFRQYLLSEQSVPVRRDVINHVSTKDIDLITDDVQEFLSICHPA